MTVCDAAVECIEYVAADHWAQRHEAPVLGHPTDTEGLGNKGRVAAKEEAIGKSSGGCDKREWLWGTDLYRKGLGKDEEGGWCD